MLDRYDQDLLLDYLEDELDSARRAQLEAMLAEDPQLATLLEQMTLDRAALRALPRAEVPADLTHDLTQALERRMLLDEDVAHETGPIPIARGRDLPGEPTGGPRWGRIAGLSALAATVALAAGIIVTTIDQDPLTPLAQKLAEPDGGEQPGDTESIADGADAGTLAADTPAAQGGPRNALAGGQPPERPVDAGARPPALEPDPGANDAIGSIAANLPDTHAPGAPVEDTEEPGPTIALAVTQPRQQLVLLTEEPDATREQLVAYCVANGIPIVQTNFNTNGQLAEPDAIDPATHLKQDPQAALTDNFAVLIDDQRLNELVVGLNNNITLNTNPVNRRNLISNQAAVVERLPAGNQALAYSEPLENDAGDSAEPAGNTTAANATAQTQLPIELRLPNNLGSAYNNDRNRDNLFVEQQRGAYNTTGNKKDATAEVESVPDEAGFELNDALSKSNTNQDNAVDGDGTVRNDADQNDATPSEPLVGQENDRAQKNNTPADQDDPERRARPLNEEAEERARNAERQRTEDNRKQDTAPLDATRGNWLSPHLPLAQTTPILKWRHADQAIQPELVPIVIQRAPLDEVNTLRVRQQLNLQGQAGTQEAQGDTPEAETPADTEPGPGNDAESELAGDAQPETDTKPATAPETGEAR